MSGDNQLLGVTTQSYNLECENKQNILFTVLIINPGGGTKHDKRYLSGILTTQLQTPMDLVSLINSGKQIWANWAEGSLSE